MANLTNIVNQKNAVDSQWRAQRLAERESLTALQDTGITQITSDPKEYARYLDLQGDNPAYSAGNIALLQMQFDGGSIFGTDDRWKKLGRFVVDTERRNGAQIFSRPPSGKGYIVKEAYDISQTQGRELSRPTLQNDSKEMETALTNILNFTQVPVVLDESLSAAAFYNQDRMELAVNPNFPDNEAFDAIAAQIALVRFHNKGRNAGYSREDCELDAQSVSYILCRRFGIEREKPDMSRLPGLYYGWNAQQRRQALDSIQDMSKLIGRSIERSITPQQRTQPPVNKAKSPTL